MRRRLTASVRPLATIAGVVLLGLSIAAPVLADANQEKIECEGRQELVRIEEKVCPATPHRPVTVVHRACCMNPAGKVHCRPFRQCPNRSPS